MAYRNLKFNLYISRFVGAPISRYVDCMKLRLIHRHYYSFIITKSIIPIYTFLCSLLTYIIFWKMGT